MRQSRFISARQFPSSDPAVSERLGYFRILDLPPLCLRKSSSISAFGPARLFYQLRVRSALSVSIIILPASVAAEALLVDARSRKGAGATEEAPRLPPTVLSSLQETRPAFFSPYLLVVFPHFFIIIIIFNQFMS